MSNGSDLSFQDFLRLPLNDSDLIRVVRMFNGKKHELVIYWKDVKTLLGQGVLLKVNGVNNPVQNILNLVDGTNITIVDNNDGSVTINATGGGGTYTVDNGLNENPAGTFKLGGTLTETTLIDAVLQIFQITSARTGLAGSLEVINTATGRAIKATSQNGAAVYGEALTTGLGGFFIAISGVGVSGNSTSGSGVNGSSNSSFGGIFSSLSGVGVGSISESTIAAALFEMRNSIGNSIETGARIDRSSYVAVANGIGIAYAYWIQTSGGTRFLAGKGQILWDDVTTVSRTSRFQQTIVQNAVERVVFELLGTGQAILNDYGIGTFAGTPTYILGVDASGNVIETTGGGGSALEILEDGVSVDANVDEINFKTPLKATQTAAGKVDVEVGIEKRINAAPTYYTNGLVKINVQVYETSETFEERFEYNSDSQITKKETKDDLRGTWVQAVYTWTGNQLNLPTYTNIVAWSIT